MYRDSESKIDLAYAATIGERTLTLKIPMRICRRMCAYRARVASSQEVQLIVLSLIAKIRSAAPIALVAAFLASSSLIADSQVLPYSEDPSSTVTSASPGRLNLPYLQPTEKAKFRNFVFDVVGPYPVFAAGFAAGIGQLNNTPPEWRQGAEGYGRRFGSDFGIATVSTTTRYVLSEVLKEDTLYYRCECRGVIPRLRYAVLATLTARRGNDGNRVFSVPALVAPYAGSMTAVYGWYPDRYGAKDAFRMGNYSLLGYVGGNIAMEFLFSGPHSPLSRMHLGKIHSAPDPGQTN